MKILITGANGFLGSSLIKRLSTIKNIDILTFNRSEQLSSLYKNIFEADFIFHLAGVSRPKDQSEFFISNTQLTGLIADFLSENKIVTPLYYPSSIHTGSLGNYGLSKLMCEMTLRELKNKNNNNIFIQVLPRIFGPGAKPNFNSVIATFCHNIANNLPICVYDESEAIEIAYIGDWVESVMNICFHNELKANLLSYKISLGDLETLLREFKVSSKSCSINIDKSLYEKLNRTFQFYENKEI